MLARFAPLAPSPAPLRDASFACAHCGSKTASGAAVADALGATSYCCAGCATVGALLRAAGLERYYDLRSGREAPVSLVDPSRRDLAWLEPIAARFAVPGVHHVALDVQGVHCAACVWVIEEMFRRSRGGIRVVVDPALGRVEIWGHEKFDLASFVREVEAFGYLFGPPLKRGDEKSDALLVRTAATVALAVLAVVVGAPPFLSSAWQGLRRGVFTLDVPIALGIVLAGTSTLVSALRAGDASYADTLAVFVALMLVGRWLAERTIRRDRERLLADPGADGLFTRRLEDGEPRLVRCTAISRGDLLLLGPGEVVPVASTLASPAAFALDWICGEPERARHAAGSLVPAGAIHVDQSFAKLTANEDFGASALRALLSPTRGVDATEGFWGTVARRYVAVVLTGAAGRRRAAARSS